jgi:hypothetical protein
MGIAQAGIAFRPIAPIVNVTSFVSNLCGKEVVQIKHPDIGQFDIRDHGDVMLQRFGDTYFICNNDLAWNFLEFPQTDVTHAYSALGSSEMFMFFCYCDSGGSYGYAFVENGRRTRSRLQTAGGTHQQSLIESGTPKDFEQRWLSADFYIEEDDCPVEERQKIYFQGDREIEVPEYFLTKRILEEALINNFGICPWDTDIEPTYYFFKFSTTKKSLWRL